MNKEIKNNIKQFYSEAKRLEQDCLAIGKNGECGNKCYIYRQGKCKNVEEIIYNDEI